MGNKAGFWDYIGAFIDPYTAIEDGQVVTATNWFDGGKNGIALTDDALNEFRGLWKVGGEGRLDDAYKARLDAAMGGGSSKSEILNYLNKYYAGKGFLWNSLSDSEKSAILDSYGASLNAQTIIDHITDVEDIGDMPNIKLPTSSELYADIDAELNPAYTTARSRLDAEESLIRQDYQDQLQSSADVYNRQASGLLSNQYLSNAQTYDALQSDMRKSRQNALEAGASAGIRLAGNVNALLTAQNKQSQTAMDTSNALAEMLLQQRNAAAGIRSDYRNYMSDVNRRKTDLDTQQRTERENLYNQRYNNSVTDYNTQMERYENKYNALDPSNKFKSYGQAYYQNKNL